MSNIKGQATNFYRAGNNYSEYIDKFKLEEIPVLVCSPRRTKNKTKIKLQYLKTFSSTRRAPLCKQLNNFEINACIFYAKST